MKTMFLVAAIAVALSPLAACTTPPPAAIGEHAAKAGPAIDRLQARYDAARPLAELLLPYLSPDRAARVRLALVLVERGLTAARTAATIAEQRAALARADAVLSAVEEPTSTKTLRQP